MLVFFYLFAYFFFFLLVLVILFFCRVNIWIKLVLVNFIFVAQYVFFFLMICRWMHTFGPEATYVLVEHAQDVLLSSSEVEEALEDPQTLSLRSRFFVFYVLLLTALSFFGLGSAIFFYSGPAVPVAEVASFYPVVEAAYAKGPLIVLPVRPYTVSHIVNIGPVLMLEWPYISSYAPVELSLGDVTFKELLNILPWLGSGSAGPLPVSTAVMVSKGYSGLEVLQHMVETAIYSSLQTPFVPGMFTDIPVENFSPLSRFFSWDELEYLSEVFPSLHPLCLSESISAETYHELYSVESVEFAPDFPGVLGTNLVPAELVPSPWRW